MCATENLQLKFQRKKPQTNSESEARKETKKEM